MTNVQMFEDAADVGSIGWRLSALDCGYSLKAERVLVDLRESGPLIRLSCDNRADKRVVVSGPLDEVVALLRRWGYLIRS